MPKAVTEITSGNQFTRSGGESGAGEDSCTRVFRVVLDSPTEVFNPETNPDVAVKVGDKHPFNDVYCTGYSVRFEGDSRLVMLCTLEYSTAGDSSGQNNDPNNQPPETRPANWTTSTSLMEVPVYVSAPLAIGDLVTGAAALATTPNQPLINPAGDIYEAASRLAPVVTISITQKETIDPTKHNKYAGSLNLEEIVLGSLTMLPGTVMFRGVSSSPAVENWGGLTRRLWECTYEFAYRSNVQTVYVPDALSTLSVECGWNIVVPVTGYNVLCFTPGTGGADDDYWGQPLAMELGKVAIDMGLPFLPQQLTDGQKARAMVRVMDFESKGLSLAPSASPIPLNMNGRPRASTATPKVLVIAHQVQPAINLTQTLNIRVYS